MRRECGDCQLCCKLLPMVDNEPWRGGTAINKPANVRCPHQKHHVGCNIYAKRPWACQMWTCRWLTNQDMGDQSRPDRAHLVVDVMPDYVTIQDNETGHKEKVQVIQVWCDPKYPHAHRDPAFRRYLARRGEEGIIALIRFNSRDTVTIIPPAMSENGEFHEIEGGQVEQRTEKDMAAFLSGATLRLEMDR